MRNQEHLFSKNQKSLPAMKQKYSDRICLMGQYNIATINHKFLYLIMGTFMFFCMMIFARTALSQDNQFELLPGEGKQCHIGQGYYFEYNFDKTPQMGTVILKVQVFDKDGNKDTSFQITGDTGMPTMRGHHDTGMVDFKKNTKGSYLLPVNIVMPGAWDIRIIFSKNGTPIYKGSVNFDI